MIAHNYEAASASLVPGSTLAVAQLRELMESNETRFQTTYTSATATNENISGEEATVPMLMQTANGRTANLTASVRRVNNKWFIVQPGIPNLPSLP